MRRSGMIGGVLRRSQSFSGPRSMSTDIQRSCGVVEWPHFIGLASEVTSTPLSKMYFRWTPHPVIVTVRDNKDYIKVLLYSYYTT